MKIQYLSLAITERGIEIIIQQNKRLFTKEVFSCIYKDLNIMNKQNSIHMLLHPAYTDNVINSKKITKPLTEFLLSLGGNT